MANKGLGKGLGALFSENGFDQDDLPSLINEIEKNAPDLTQNMIPVDQIQPNPYQPRKHFDEEKLNELAVSIKEHGVIQPLILKKSADGYDIVAGERRYRASKIAGLSEVPSILVEFSDQQMMEIALLENIQREDLNAIEEAKAYQMLMEKLDLTQEELSKRVGKSRAHIANMVRLLNMPSELQDYVLDGTLSMGHIRPLITIDEDKALKVAKRAIDESLSVREVEDLVKGIKLSKQRKDKPKIEKSEKQNYAEELFRKKYHIKAKVNEKTITIKYADEDDLDRILVKIGLIEEGK